MLTNTHTHHAPLPGSARVPRADEGRPAPRPLGFGFEAVGRQSAILSFGIFLGFGILGFGISAAALQITPAEVTTTVGQTTKLELSGGGSGASTLTAHSNAPDVAAIAPDGTLRALSPGHALLSFRHGNDYATVPVTVKNADADSPDFPKTDDTHLIDLAVNKNLRALGVPPSPLCTDAEFLRRACLDLMGALPPADKSREFLASDDPQKRAKLVDWIFTRPEYAEYWAMRWCDVLRVKSEFPSNLWPQAVAIYHAWLRDAIAANMRYDAMARALLLTAGSNFRNPPANFYRATERRTPEGLASAFAIIFMGARLDCADRDDYPYRTWTKPQARGLAAFFTDVSYKSTGEWKEEIVYFNDWWKPYQLDGKTITPSLPGRGPVTFDRLANPRKILADWLTAPDNPYFARHLADRYWKTLFGRGITQPVDDVRPDNPPSNPELLDILARQLISTGYDLRALLRYIATSQTYQRSSVATDANRADLQNFSHYIPRRLDAEILADAVGAATGAYESFSSRIPEPIALWPDDFHAVQNPDSSVTTGFLEAFGRPGRDTSYDYERTRTPSLSQALYFFDSDELTKKLKKKDGVIATLAKQFGTDYAAYCEEYYLKLLCRPPTGAERARALRYIKDAPANNKLQAQQDIVWALLNTKEFLYQH